MSAVLVASTSKYSGDGSVQFSTSALDTTGANLLIIVRASYGTPAVAPTDSKTNTWQALTLYGSTPYIQIYYAYSPTVGTNHTFTQPADTNASWPTLFVLAYSGMVAGATVYDTSNGHTDNSSQSITPAETGELIITGFATAEAGTPTPDGAFTALFQQAFNSGTCIGGGVEYINPYASTSAKEATWNITGPANIAAFKILSATATQLATRARRDDGNEAGASTIADGNFTAPLDTNVRLRVQVDTSGDYPATAFQLEAQKSGDLVWTKVT